jgi:WXG100 family type VII secretion target
MSDSIIKMDYDLMQDMSRQFSDGAQQLEDVLSEMQNIAATLENGALLGEGGYAFTSAIRERLCPAIQRLVDKFNEIEADLMGALTYMRDGDSNARSRFLN